MRQRTILVGAAAAVCVAVATFSLALTGALGPSASAAPAPGTLQQTVPSPCVVTASKSVAPPIVRLGQEVTVTLRTDLVCPDAPPPLHLVLVLDGSGSMQGTLSQRMKQAVGQLVRSLDLAGNPGRLAAVVEYNIQARTLCRLTDTESHLLGCVNRVGASGGSRIDLGLTEALRALVSGRGGVDRSAREAIVLVSDGSNNAGCDPVLQAARQVRGQGVLLVTVCIGAQCDVPCMRDVASHPRLFFDVPNPADLPAAMAEIGRILDGAVVRWLEVEEHPGDEMTGLYGTMRPAGTTLPGGGAVWHEPWAPDAPLTMTLRLRPERLGYWPADREATGTLQDFESRTLAWQYPVPWVLVIDPSVPPTVTVTVPPTPPPTITPSASPVPPPTATPVYPVPLVVCDEIRAKVPPAAIGAALADPAGVAGYGRLCRPELPPGPTNTLRGSLSIMSASKPYHPLYNALVWKCGCP